ncbi:hypothetical protein [Nocardioides sp.]|uniref:hypothetical protein n=1 Tax=Nocardioides sp. TaxID=35761 RepID=UPI00261C54B6|nr:hypothetical protein [Nocardioides sp.]
MADLDFIYVVGRFGLVVADGDDAGTDPDTVWCDAGTVNLTPLTTYAKVAGGSPIGWNSGHAVYPATLDNSGYLTRSGSRWIRVVDMTSDKVNPQIPAGKATHTVEYAGVKAAGTVVKYPSQDVRIAADTASPIETAEEATALGLPIGTLVCDLVKLLPVPTSSGTPIVQGPRGFGVEAASVDGQDLVLTLGSGAEVRTELPTSMVDSAAFVGEQIQTPGTPAEIALKANFAASTPLPTGVKVISESLQSAIDRVAATGGGMLGIPDGVVDISAADITVPRSVGLYGNGPSGAIIQTDGTGPNRYIKIGGSADLLGNWLPQIANLDLRRVGIVGGEASSDWAYGLVLRDLNITAVTTGIRAKYNSWLWRIDNCNIHHCGTGVKWDFSGIGGGSGASMTITGGAIQSCSTAGFWQDGTAVDGTHVRLDGVDLERSKVAVKVTGATGGACVIDLDGCHFELGLDSYIQADSGVITVSTPWMFPFDSTGGRVAFFDLSGDAQVVTRGGRIAWTDTTSPLHRITSSSARLLVDPHSTVMPSAGALAAPDVYPGSPMAASGTFGMRMIPGPITGKFHQVGATITATSQTIISIPPGDSTVYQLRHQIDVTAVGTTNKFRYLIDPGGNVAMDITLPNAVGTADCLVTVSRTRATVAWTYSDGSSGFARTAPSHAVGTRVYVGIGLIGGGNSTATVQSPIVTALANNG